MKHRVKCTLCGNPLTTWLELVSSDFDPEWKDGENVIPQGKYWIVDDGMVNLEGQILIHLDDRLNLTNHPESERWVGCCGPSAGMPNQLCGKCGAEVATEVSDCWTSYYVHFEQDKTDLMAESDL
ncbi:hypothetical protein HNQ40_000145 [Algisphaera agarilytica]|uniref:Uncharacterized protein n=1 Tax=Algisphaera agarilytica TaxID=1385975 RepID=A0A7X0LJ24_9BACT|nr:hypothetical protein [Algisphaera agarilytica]